MPAHTVWRPYHADARHHRQTTKRAPRIASVPPGSAGGFSVVCKRNKAVTEFDCKSGPKVTDRERRKWRSILCTDRQPPTCLRIARAQGALLGAEEHVPDNSHSKHHKYQADREEKQDRRPWFGLPGFSGRFDDNAVLFLHHKRRASFCRMTYPAGTKTGGARWFLHHKSCRDPAPVGNHPIKPKKNIGLREIRGTQHWGEIASGISADMSAKDESGQRGQQGPLRARVLNDCDYGQSHLSSEVGGQQQCGKCSGAENTDGGDKGVHLNVPSCCTKKAEPGCFAIASCAYRPTSFTRE